MGGTLSDVAATETPWHRLARYVRERREDLGYTQSELHAAGGPSVASLVLIEGAKRDSYKPQTVKRLETSLGWARGSVRDVLAGREPALAPIVEVSDDNGRIARGGELDLRDPEVLRGLLIKAAELLGERHSEDG